jgi:hypothetical protein
MSSEMLKAYTTKYTHAVGNLNAWDIQTLPYGAIVTEAAVDNFTLVEDAGFNSDGERICKQLSAVTKHGYLVAAPERRYFDGEPMTNFFNAIGDRARLVILQEGKSFDTSAFSLNTGVTAITYGHVAHFDPTTKKFIISDPTSAHADYANAVDKFTVISDESDLEYNCGLATVRLEVK